jgi:pimeloyl-ACP methyl ester carboxylesterase
MVSWRMRKILIVVLGFLCAASDSVLGADDKPSDIAFTSNYDQSVQRYLIKLPAGGVPKPARLVIALHGHGSDRQQFMNPSSSHEEIRATLDFVQSNTCIYVSPDYRAPTSWMGPAAEADLIQIIGDLKKQYQVSKVILCGGSMGGTSALAFAAMHPDLIDGVVSMNGTANLVEYENFQDAIQASYGGTKKQVFQEYKKRSAEYWPERLTMPVAITLGGKDTIVPPDSALRLGKTLQKLQPSVKLTYREEMEHSTKYQDVTDAFTFVFAAVGP